MKINLSVPITEEIFNTLLKLGSSKEIPPVAQFGHVGTHFDVMDKRFDLSNTERPGKVFDVRQISGNEVKMSDIDLTQIQTGDFVMFHTGYLNAKQYGTSEYFKNHPQLSNKLITYLVEQKVSMIGIDTAGIRQPAEHPQIDRYCADHDVFVIENLTNLDLLLKETKNRDFIVHTYPVNYEGLSGLPCRVVAEF